MLNDVSSLLYKTLIISIFSSPLDYDDIASHRYEFIVRATDRGVNQQSSTANIIVTVTNVNDNNPLIDNS